MEKLFTIKINTETKEITITLPDGTIRVEGFMLLTGNKEQDYVLHWGAYAPMVRAFYKSINDPFFRGFAEELYRTNQKHITEAEALEKFEAECGCVGDGGCVCGNKKSFH